MYLNYYPESDSTGIKCICVYSCWWWHTWRSKETRLWSASCVCRCWVTDAASAAGGDAESDAQRDGHRDRQRQQLMDEKAVTRSAVFASSHVSVILRWRIASVTSWVTVIVIQLRCSSSHCRTNNPIEIEFSLRSMQVCSLLSAAGWS